MADIFTDNITLTKGTKTKITLNTADKYVLDDIVVNVTPQAGSFNDQPTSGETYDENTSAVTAIPEEGKVYINKGWFDNTYIPVTTVTGDTNSGTVSRTDGSATADITNPTVTINKSGKFVPENGGANYGVTTEQPEGADGEMYLTLSIEGTASGGSVSGTATIDYSRAAVTSSKLARGAINQPAGSTLLSSDTGSLSQEITGSVSAEVSGEVKYFVPIVKASASVSEHTITNPKVQYNQSSSYSINGTTQSSVPSGVVVSSSQPSDFNSSSYITLTPGATVTDGSSVSTATASIDKGITGRTSETSSDTKSVPVTSSVNNNCYIKVYTGGYLVKEIHDLSMLDYKGSALQSRETANCYIVSETGYYELPLVYGCGIVDGNTNSASYTQVSGSNTKPFFNYLNRQINSPFIEEDTGVTAVGASVVLTDTADFVIDDVYLTDGDLCKFLRFHVSSMPTLGGNATIAVKDETGQIMWSWHIWAYPFALHTFKHTNASGNTYNILDVNLGWVKQSVDSKKGTSPYYQWGRKDPMLRGNTSAAVGSFNITGCATSVAATIQNPNVFNTQDGTNNNWWTNDGTLVNFYNYWDASQTTTGAGHKSIVKTVYDPSPIGFHIPCGATFTGFSASNGGTWDNGYTWDNNFFQAAGSRFRVDGEINGSVGDSGYYWLASSSVRSANYLRFLPNDVSPQFSSGSALGFSVRPVARSL